MWKDFGPITLGAAFAGTTALAAHQLLGLEGDTWAMLLTLWVGACLLVFGIVPVAREER